MKTIALLSVLFLLGLTNNAKPAESDVIEHLENISVKIKVNDGSGSGTIFTRKDSTGTNDITFIWTCAHLFSHVEDVFSMMFFGQFTTNTPIIDHAIIIQNLFNKDGAVCGSTNRLAKVIKYSDGETGQDLALLQLDGRFFNKDTVIFNLTGKPARIGTPLLTVASPRGKTQSFSRGDISMVGGSSLKGNVLDQTTCVVYPGSSGSGIFTTDGKYVGMVTIMEEPNINFMIPIRRIQEWAKKEHIEWAIDPGVSMPTEKELKSIKIGDLDKKNPSISTNSTLTVTPRNNNSPNH